MSRNLITRSRWVVVTVRSVSTAASTCRAMASRTASNRAISAWVRTISPWFRSHTKRDAEAEAQGVVGPDPLILELGRDVPPGIGPREPMIGAGPLHVGPRRLEIRPVVEGRPHQDRAVEG